MRYFTTATPKWLFTLTMESVAVDLTAADVYCTIKAEGDSTCLVENDTCGVTNPATGECEYTLTSAFSSVATHNLQLKVDFGDGELRFTNLIDFGVAAYRTA